LLKKLRVFTAVGPSQDAGTHDVTCEIKFGPQIVLLGALAVKRQSRKHCGGP